MVKIDDDLNARYLKLRDAAMNLLAAMDRTLFLDLGFDEAEKPATCEGKMEDGELLDGAGAGWENGPLTAGDVRRLREALK